MTVTDLSLYAQQAKTAADTIEFARLGARLSLNWTVVVRDLATLTACAEHVGADVDGFEDLFPVVSTVEIGREASAALYVTLPFFPGQKNGSGPGDTCATEARYSDAELVALAERVIAWAKSKGADEISTQQHPYGDGPVWNAAGAQPYRIRIWWD